MFVLQVCMILFPAQLDCGKLTELRYEEMERAVTYLTFDENLQFRTLGNAYNRIFNRINGKWIGDINRLQAYSNKINEALFDKKELDEITSIGNEYKLNPIYRQKLISTLRNAYMHSIEKEHNTIGFVNFRNFMNALNIKPLTVRVLQSSKFRELPSYVHLLVTMSKIMAHPFIFSDTSSCADSFWNNETFAVPKYYSEVMTNKNSYFVFKILYEGSYLLAECLNYLARSSEIQYLKPNATQMKHLCSLMNEWNFIPWTLPKSQVKDIPMLMDIITVYDKALTATFRVVLRRLLFSENFMAELHSKFIFTVLQDDHIHFNNFSGYEEQFMIMKKILKRMFRFFALPMIRNGRVAFKEIVRLIHEKNGSRLLQSVSEYDPVADFPPLDNNYFTMLLDILSEIGASDIRQKN